MREEPKRLPGCVLLAGWCLHTLGEIAPVSCLRGATGLGQDGPAKSLSPSDLTSQVGSKGEAFHASDLGRLLDQQCVHGTQRTGFSFKSSLSSAQTVLVGAPCCA